MKPKDERHSYLVGMCNHVGPGAYTIPSTFRRRMPNKLIRAVQRENYGREFASTQQGTVSTAHSHRARRDELRRVLQLELDCNDQHQSEDVSSVSPQKADRNRVNSPGGRSANSRSSSPRHRKVSEDIADIVADFGEQQSSIETSDNNDRKHQHYAFTPPLTYQHYLMTTSYMERLKQQQRQRAASQ
ncbi:hypothetical protein PHYBOEH_005454 [Phytophthora boehmeriae]|uniref:Uncharacterized protein n=1 Tax=Phytophthora boehmeriae TaxID=109152 RepID=A0A8T1WQZ3_9STRA|nr:hypothetical protein PHYBOEH_005454 [Phytophthora boehmeriae]